MRWMISHVPVSAGSASPRKPTTANNAPARTKRPRFVAMPASETMMSPLRKLRYFRGVTGTGLAAPKVNRPFDANHRMTGNSTVMNGSMCLRGLSVSRPSM